MATEAGSIVINVAGNINGALTSYKALEQRTRSTASTIERNLNNIKTNVLESKIGGLQTAMASLGGITIAKSMLEVSVQLQSIKASLEGITGSSTQASMEFEFLNKNAKELGVNFLASATDFRILLGASKGSGFAMGDLEKTFTAVSKAALVMGMRADDVTGVMRALGQMMSKGSVQAEELKGQIGDRLYGSIEKASRAMGMTTKELFKAMETGKLFTSDFLMKFVKVIDEDFSPSVDKMKGTTLYALNQMTNSWIMFQDRVANSSGLTSGVGQLATSMSSLLDKMDAETIDNIGRAIMALGAGYAAHAITQSAVLTSSGKLSAMLTLLTTAFDSTTASSYAASQANVRQSATSNAVAMGMARESAATIASRNAMIAKTQAMAAMRASFVTIAPVLAIAAVAYASFADDSKQKIEDLRSSVKGLTEDNAAMTISKLAEEIFNTEKELSLMQGKAGSAVEQEMQKLFGGKTTGQLIRQKNELNRFMNEAVAKLEEIKKINSEKDKGNNKQKDKDDPKAEVQAAIDSLKRLKLELSNIGKTGWDATLGDITEKVTKWTQDVDKWNKTAGKENKIKLDSTDIENAKNKLIALADSEYKFAQLGVRSEFLDDIQKTLIEINIKYDELSKKFNKSGDNTAESWKKNAQNVAWYTEKLRVANIESSVQDTINEGLIDGLNKQKIVHDKIIEDIKEKIRLEEQYKTVGYDERIKQLKAEMSLESSKYDEYERLRKRDVQLEIASYGNRNEYQKLMYAKEYEEALKVTSDIESAQKIAHERTKQDWEKQIDDMKDIGRGLQSVMTNAMGGIEDAIVEATKTGKANFKDMANAIMEDLLRMTIRMTITSNIMNGLGMSGAFSNNTPTTTTTVTQPASFNPTVVYTPYNGGISNGTSMQKFSTGYLAGGGYNNVDSKANDTIPALISKGEAVIPASVVNKNRGLIEALISSRANKFSNGFISSQGSVTTQKNSNVKVEVINQSSQQVEASNVQVTQSEQEGMIIGIVVNDIRRGGAVAQAIRS